MTCSRIAILILILKLRTNSWSRKGEREKRKKEKEKRKNGATAEDRTPATIRAAVRLLINHFAQRKGRKKEGTGRGRALSARTMANQTGSGSTLFFEKRKKKKEEGKRGSKRHHR